MASTSEVEHRFVTLRWLRGERLAEHPQSAAEREHIRGQERDRRGRDPSQPAVSDDESIRRGLVRRDRFVAEADLADEFDGVGGVVQETLRTPLERVSVLDFRADLAARSRTRLEEGDVFDPVVDLEPGRSGESGDPASDDGNLDVGHRQRVPGWMKGISQDRSVMPTSPHVPKPASPGWAGADDGGDGRGLVGGRATRSKRQATRVVVGRVATEP
jgi:hypothetical protein